MKPKTNYFKSMRGKTNFIRSNGKPYTTRNHRTRFFFPDEWMLFYDSLSKRKDKKYSRQQITFQTLLQTGARIMEAQNIKVEDIDLIRGSIVLRITKRVISRPSWRKKNTDDKTEPIKGKRNIRVIGISKQFNKFLKKVIKDYKLKSGDKLPILTTQGTNKVLRINLKEIGVADWDMFSSHNIRKTAEMWCLTLGMDSFKVVKRFGHSREIALKHYLSSDIFSLEDKQMIKQFLGDLDKR